MPLLLTRSSGATSLAIRPDDPTLSAIVEFQSPTAALVAAPVPRAARGTIWGDNTGGTSHYTASPPQLLTNVTFTVYGRVPPLQDVSVGAYTDTVVVTITF